LKDKLKENSMEQKIKGLENLSKKDIKDMKCNMDKPFAFISYAHNEQHDSPIVLTVFKQLMKKGYNLWIDVVNLQRNENGWDEAAMDALGSENCKFTIYFRSEESMINLNIEGELVKSKKFVHIRNIKVIDIWHKEGMNADIYYEEILNKKHKNRNVCDRICKIVKPECNAIRLASDSDNDISKLVDHMEADDDMKTIKITTTESMDKPVVIDNHKEVDNANETYMGRVNRSTLLKDFEKLCESVDFCVALGNARSNIRHGGKGLFDYLMAALLRGCDADIYDKKNNRIVRLAGYNYNKYAVAENPDDPKTSDIQYPWTWTTNCRKSIKKEDIPERFFNEKGKVKSGRLEDFNKIFEELEPETSIGEVLEKFEKCEKGFDTKDNKLILEAWDLIESINLNSGKKGLQEIL
jgi:hypothetical protein